MLEMTQWTIFTALFSLYSVLHGQEPQAPTLQICCLNGRDAAQRVRDCTILPPISRSHSCRIVQERCCTAEKIKKLCDHGVEFAQNQGVCERPFFTGQGYETEISKTCCDCCMLGQLALDENKNCNFQDLFLDAHCERTAKVCCGQNTTEVQPKESICSQLRKNGTCVCHDGYQLMGDGVSCQDINECLTGSHNCVSSQTCINTEGSFRCQRKSSCGAGYELRDNNTCKDIDECARGSHNCGPEFVCTNTAGSFHCHPKEKCPTGFIQDAAGNCTDMNECVANDSPCHPGQTCINTVGSYICRKNAVFCGKGYQLSENGTHCKDIDECRTGSVCVGHGCTNLLGSYRCECRAGFTFNRISKSCEDINECRGPRLCAHKCVNTEGSYQCNCSAGFKLATDGRGCDDINECDQNPCNQECVNVYGSYHCSCHRGFQLSAIDGVTCDDIDECSLPAGSQVCSYRCSNTPGSFVCTCPAHGYILSPNGRTCQDIDECAAGNHNCHGSESCFNVQGGFRCLSLKCPENFQQVRPGISRKNLQCISNCTSPTCVRIITYSALSLPSFVELTQPEDIIFLRTATEAKPASGAANVSFEIVAGNEHLAFRVVWRLHQDRIIGVVQQVIPIPGPKDVVLHVAMKYMKSGVISHQNVVVINLFISNYWF